MWARPRVLALLALCHAARSDSTANCTEAACAVRASELGASFQVQAMSHVMPQGCLLFEQGDWTHWDPTHRSQQVIYVEECVGDECNSDHHGDVGDRGGEGADHAGCACAVCPCTILDCSGNPTASPTVAPISPSSAPTASRAPSAGRDVTTDHQRSHQRSGTKRWLFPSSLIVLACFPCCAFVAGKWPAKARGGTQGAHESELVRVAAYSMLGKEASATGPELEV